MDDKTGKRPSCQTSEKTSQEIAEASGLLAGSRGNLTGSVFPQRDSVGREGDNPVAESVTFRGRQQLA